MKMSKQIYVIFTGLIRYPDNFHKQIDLFKELKITMILSTWENENITKEYENKINIIYNTKNKDNSNKNNSFNSKNEWIYVNMGQSVLLYNGLTYVKSLLNGITDDIYILKTRPDIFIPKDLLNHILSFDYSIKENIYNITSKTWVPWASVIKPFYLEDICHLSDFQTTLRFCNLKGYDHFNNQYYIGQGKGHIIRYILPFLTNKNISDFYSLNSDYNYNIINNNYKDTNKIKHILYDYYFLLKNYFIIFTPENINILFKLQPSKKRFITYNNGNFINKTSKIEVIYDSKHIDYLIKDLS